MNIFHLQYQLSVWIIYNNSSNNISVGTKQIFISILICSLIPLNTHLCFTFRQTCLGEGEFSGASLSHRCDIITLSSASTLSSSGSSSSSSLLQWWLLAPGSDWEFCLTGVLRKPSFSSPASRSMKAWSWLLSTWTTKKSL